MEGALDKLRLALSLHWGRIYGGKCACVEGKGRRGVCYSLRHKISHLDFFFFNLKGNKIIESK